MLELRSVLGLGTLETTGEPSARTPMGALMDALKNPVHAAILASAYLIWFLTSSVDAAQKRTENKVDQANAALIAVEKSDAERAEHDKVHDALLRQICIGVNKGSAQKDCGK